MMKQEIIIPKNYKIVIFWPQTEDIDTAFMYGATVLSISKSIYKDKNWLGERKFTLEEIKDIIKYFKKNDL